MSDRIEKTVLLKAPLPRVWSALTDHEAFGAWFRVELDGPFVPGGVSTGRMTYPGFEGWPWRARIERMEPRRLFSFRWHDFDPGLGLDVSEQPATLVEFHLAAAAGGVRLTIVESGFDVIPNPRRLEVLRDNAKGWAIQAGNLADYVGG